MLPWDLHKKLAKEITPSLRYQEGENFAEWQKNARAKLTELLGLPLPSCDPEFAIEYDVETAEFREIRFTFQSEPGYRVPGHLLVPHTDAKKIPLFVCLQGHSKGMHISLGRPKFEGDEESIAGGDRDFALRIVKEGYCALAVEQRCFGECGGTEKGPDCAKSSMTALMIGRTTIGERVWDVSRVLDVIAEKFDFVDMDKIGCMGNSGGGTATFYIGCLEERVKYVMPSCAVCTFWDSIIDLHHCTCNYVPNIAKYFDMGDMAGMIAPRNLVIVCGKDDPIFPLHGVQATLELAKPLYAAAGNPDGVTMVVGQGGHRFYADDSWPVMNEMMKK